VDRDKTTILTAEEFDLSLFGDNSSLSDGEDDFMQTQITINLWVLQCTNWLLLCNSVKENLWWDIFEVVAEKHVVWQTARK
jgi:hypothetical protein